MENLIEFVRAESLVNVAENAPKKPAKLTKWEREQTKEAAKGIKRVATGEAKAPAATPKKAAAAAAPSGSTPSSGAAASPFGQGTAGSTPTPGAAASPFSVAGNSPSGAEASSAGGAFSAFGTALM